VPWTDGRDYWWHDEMDDVEPSCYPVWVSSEDPLFMLYTRSASLVICVNTFITKSYKLLITISK